MRSFIQSATAYPTISCSLSLSKIENHSSSLSFVVSIPYAIISCARHLVAGRLMQCSACIRVLVSCSTSKIESSSASESNLNSTKSFFQKYDISLTMPSLILKVSFVWHFYFIKLGYKNTPRIYHICLSNP